MDEAIIPEITLSQKVREIQLREDLTDIEIAGKIGINVTMYRYFTDGKREAGRKFLGGLSQAFPELQPWITLYLRGEIPGAENK